MRAASTGSDFQGRAYDYISVIKFLLVSGADIHAQDNVGAILGWMLPHPSIMDQLCMGMG